MQSAAKTCGGRQILSKYLNKSITPNDVGKLTTAGFAFDTKYLSLGLIKLYYSNLIINGNFYNKLITVMCKNNVEDSECIELANEAIKQIEEILH